MARGIQSIPTSDIRKIAVCPLYKASGLSVNNHYFCVDCSEKLTEDVPCPLCRPFLAIQDDGHDGVARNCLVDKLEDLHQQFVENTLNISNEKRFGERIVHSIFNST